MSKPNRIIITGASGQIGSYLREFLLKETDAMIFGLSKYGDKVIKNTDRIKMVYCDIRYPSSVEKRIKEIGPDYFINLAAIPKNNLCEATPKQAFDTNVHGVLNILLSLKKFAPNCRFFNAGSMYEFSKNDLYSTTKKAARNIVDSFREKGMYAIQGYIGHAESPLRTDNYIVRKITKGVARIKRALDRGLPFQPIQVGNLEEKLDITHSSDIAEGIWRMLNQEKYRKSKKMLGGSHERLWLGEEHKNWLKEYILSTGESHSIREIIETAFRKAGITTLYWFKSNPDDKWVSLWSQGMDDMGAPIQDELVRVSSEFYKPYVESIIPKNAESARTELGWIPQVSFEQIIEEMVNTDLKNY